MIIGAFVGAVILGVVIAIVTGDVGAEREGR